MLKIDDHLHLVLEKMDTPFPNGMKIAGAEEMLPHLEENGIGYGILMSGDPEQFFGSNESNCEICRRFPEKYSWLCNLTETTTENVEEYFRSCKEKGAVGIGEFIINHRLDHPFIQKVFAAAEKLEMPLLFHMSPEEGFSYGIVDEPGLPLLEQTLKQYPKLMLIGHSQSFWHEISKDASPERDERNSWGKGPVVPGGRLPELFSKYPNLYGDLSANSGGNAMMRDEKFGLAFLEEFQDRLMFGTDMANTEMTFPLGNWLDKMYNEGKLSQAAYEKVCYKNAVKVFRLQIESEE